MKLAFVVLVLAMSGCAAEIFSDDVPKECVATEFYTDFDYATGAHRHRIYDCSGVDVSKLRRINQ